jgi:uncharacterized protein YbjT (DUF2867 family)
MKVFVFGGTGFLGNFVVRELLGQGHQVVLLVHKKRAAFDEGVEVIEGDVLRPDTYSEVLRTCDAVINLIGIIKEQPGKVTFQMMHVEATKNILMLLQQSGPKRYLHTSALGVSPAPVSTYFETKLQAEVLVQQSVLDWTIFRPSILWHDESDFVKQLDTLIQLPLVTPVLGKGQTKFQIIKVEDVATEYVQILGDRSWFQKIIELGGPKVYTFSELLHQRELLKFGKTKPHLHIPIVLASIAIRISEMLRIPMPLTYDQFKMLKVDNILTKPTERKHRVVV